VPPEVAGSIISLYIYTTNGADSDTVTYLAYRVSGSTLTAVGRPQLLARWPGTHSRILSAIQRAAQTVLGRLGVYLKVLVRALLVHPAH